MPAVQQAEINMSRLKQEGRGPGVDDSKHADSLEMQDPEFSSCPASLTAQGANNWSPFAVCICALMNPGLGSCWWIAPRTTGHGQYTPLSPALSRQSSLAGVEER